MTTEDWALSILICVGTLLTTGLYLSHDSSNMVFLSETAEATVLPVLQGRTRKSDQSTEAW